MSTDDKNPRIWFPTKTYGWGWAPPIVWQGWVVMLVFVGLLVVIAVVFPPSKQMGTFLGLAGVDTLLLVAVCYWKGEKPKWRWGNDKENR